MKLTLDISDDLKPDELGLLVQLAKESGKQVGVLILEAARELAARRKSQCLEPQQAVVS